MSVDIQFNHDNAMDKRVGAEGLTTADLSKQAVSAAVAAFRARVEAGEVRFPDLPELYGVDAFNQPGVELGKKLRYGLMGRKGNEEFARKLKA